MRTVSINADAKLVVVSILLPVLLTLGACSGSEPSADVWQFEALKTSDGSDAIPRSDFEARTSAPGFRAMQQAVQKADFVAGFECRLRTGQLEVPRSWWTVQYVERGQEAVVFISDNRPLYSSTGAREDEDLRDQEYPEIRRVKLDGPVVELRQCANKLLEGDKFRLREWQTPLWLDETALLVHVRDGSREVKSVGVRPSQFLAGVGWLHGEEPNEWAAEEAIVKALIELWRHSLSEADSPQPIQYKLGHLNTSYAIADMLVSIPATFRLHGRIVSRSEAISVFFNAHRMGWRDALADFAHERVDFRDWGPKKYHCRNLFEVHAYSEGKALGIEMLGSLQEEYTKEAAVAAVREALDQQH